MTLRPLHFLNPCRLTKKLGLFRGITSGIYIFHSARLQSVLTWVTVSYPVVWYTLKKRWLWIPQFKTSLNLHLLYHLSRLGKSKQWKTRKNRHSRGPLVMKRAPGDLPCRLPTHSLH